MSEGFSPTWVFVSSTPAHGVLQERLARSLGVHVRLITIDVNSADFDPYRHSDSQVNPGPHFRFRAKTKERLTVVALQAAGASSHVICLVGLWAARTTWGRKMVARTVAAALRYVEQQALEFCEAQVRFKFPVSLHLLMVSPSLRRWFIACGRASAVRNFLAAQEVQLLIFPEDNILDLSAMWVTALSHISAAAVVVQYTVGVEQEWLAHFHNGTTTRRSRAEAALVKQIWPAFTRTTSSGRVVAFPWLIPASCAHVGRFPSHPWSGYGGFVSAYLVDSPLEAVRARDALAPGYRVHEVEPVEVTLVRQLRLSHDLNQGRPVVALLIPPNQFTSSDSPDRYSRLVQEIVRDVRNALVGLGDLVVVPHPRSHEELLKTLREIEPCPAYEPDLIRALASCSIMITYGSATSRLAEELNVGLVDWDVYNYGYNDLFVQGDRRLAVKSAEEMASALKSILVASGLAPTTRRRRSISDLLLAISRDGQ